MPPMYRPAPDAPYALLREMAAAPGLIAGFDATRFSDWHRAASACGRLFITGEGSSRIFPAHNLASLAAHHQPGWNITTEGARQAAERPLTGQMVIGLSNSGQTREVIDFCTARQAAGLATFGITATPDSPLSHLTRPCAVLACGAETAVAATKSVIEQALILQAVLGGAALAGQAKAAALADDLLAMEIPEPLVEAIAQAETLYVAGRNDGAAEEIALKACEITRSKSFYLEGTYILHGIEEVMTPRDVVLLIEPFAQDMAYYQKILSAGVGLTVIAIASNATPFPTLHIPRQANFNGYLQLIAAWRLLAAAGLQRGVDLDRTLRARKVGNPVEAL